MSRCVHVVTNYVCKYGSEFKEFSNNPYDLSNMFTDLGYCADEDEDLWEFPEDSFRETLEQLKNEDDDFFIHYRVNRGAVIRLMEAMLKENKTKDGYVRLSWF